MNDKKYLPYSKRRLECMDNTLFGYFSITERHITDGCTDDEMRALHRTAVADTNEIWAMEIRNYMHLHECLNIKVGENISIEQLYKKVFKHLRDFIIVEKDRYTIHSLKTSRTMYETFATYSGGYGVEKINTISADFKIANTKREELEIMYLIEKISIFLQHQSSVWGIYPEVISNSWELTGQFLWNVRIEAAQYLSEHFRPLETITGNERHNDIVKLEKVDLLTIS